MAKVLFGINAIVAWAGVLLSFTLNVTGHYVGTGDPTKPTLLGNVPSGIDTPWERFFDWITYFTLWSNIVVAVVVTVVWLRPDLFTRSDRAGFIWRTLRLDSMIMIIVTGVLYNLLLATPKAGVDAVSNALLHIITPLVTVLVWLIVGPRGLISFKTIPAALVVPLAWVVFALVRGAIIGAYPYPFLDVATKGLPSVLQFIVVIVVIAVILSLVLMGIDSLIRKSVRKDDPAPA